MNSRILVLIAASLIGFGCSVTDTSTRAPESATPYGSSDEPFPVLNAYGNWFNIAPYGRVWQPAVMPDWRPYTIGQWVWTDRGWMWDSDEPFGWVVYHYGYWLQMEALGWIWIPGNEWSPARVDWYSGDDYVGWAPMAPPQASLPYAYQPGYENSWVVVPAPQFTRLNVGAYRVTPPRPPVPVTRGRTVERPPDIITIQGATHQLISPRRTEEEKVRNGRRTVGRVRLAPPANPVPSPIYVAPAPPDASQPPSPPVVLPGGARVVPATPPPSAPPTPPSQRAPAPIRVTPAPAPVKVAPVPAPATPAPPPARVTPATPAPVTVTPAPAPRRVAVPEKPPEKKEEKKEVKKEIKKEAK